MSLLLTEFKDCQWRCTPVCVASVVGVLLLCCLGCDRGNVEAQQTLVQLEVGNPSPTAGYIEDSQCASCHAELFDSYQEVGMANSFYLPGSRPLIEDFENNHYYHAPSDRHYEMTEENGEIYQHRYQLDENGSRVNAIKIKVDAILGSGNHVRSYLYRTPAGEMFQMPLAWYSKTKKWRMNPGYDRPNHFGFHRKINRECMFCHNAFPVDAAVGSDRHWEPYVFPEKLPHGIGCQRCHGPGEKHVELANAGADLVEIESSVVNPADLSLELQNDVCLQCHLQPSSQILSELVRQDRSEYSYRPGQPLAEYRALLDYEEGKNEVGERFEINHHAYRLQQSACFLHSSEALNCTSCHDPHRKVPVAERITHFRASCLKCHEVGSCDSAVSIESMETQNQANCVSCHMPERRTQDVIHATMTDHRIGVYSESKEERLKAREEPPAPGQNAVIQPFVFGSREQLNSDAIQLYEAIAGSHLGDLNAMRVLSRYVRDQGNKVAALPLAELVDALRLGGDLQGELDVLVRATKLYPDRMQPHLELGMALAAAGDYENAFDYYRRALKIGPPLPETYVGIGMSLLHNNRVSAAATQFKEALKLRPWYPEALLNLGIIYFNEKNWDDARKYLGDALSADPTFVEANEYLKRIPVK